MNIDFLFVRTLTISLKVTDAGCLRMDAQSVRQTRNHAGRRTVGETDYIGSPVKHTQPTGQEVRSRITQAGSPYLSSCQGNTGPLPNHLSLVFGCKHGLRATAAAEVALGNSSSEIACSCRVAAFSNHRENACKKSTISRATSLRYDPNRWFRNVTPI